MSMSFTADTKQMMWALEVLFERDLSELGLAEVETDWLTIHLAEQPSENDAYKLVPEGWTYTSHRVYAVSTEDIEEIGEDMQDYAYDLMMSFADDYDGEPLYDCF